MDITNQESDKGKGLINKLSITDLELYAACTLLIVSIVFNHQLLQENLELKSDLSLSQQTQTENSTSKIADWKTYKNTDIGFSLSHPQDWTIELLQPPQEEVVLKSSETTIGLVKLRTSPVLGMSLDNWFDSLSSPDTTYDGSGEITSREEITVSGITGLKLEESFETKTTVIYLPLDESVFRIIIKPAKAFENALVAQILSTFKFSGVEIDSNFTLPGLYPDLKWVTVPEDQKKLSNPALLRENSDGYKQVVLPGIEWVATSNNRINLEGYYSQELKPLDWDTSIPSFTISGNNFSTISSGGPQGSILGFFLVQNGKVRIINVRETYESEKADMPWEYRVFISDTLSTNQLLDLGK